jgi:hypothetical protein
MKSRKLRSLSRLDLHGLTPEQTLFLKEQQYHKCKICQIQNHNLVVDHSHVTGKVRGAVCCKCNIRLGHLESILRDGSLDSYLEYLKCSEPGNGTLKLSVSRNI